MLYLPPVVRVLICVYVCTAPGCLCRFGTLPALASLLGFSTGRASMRGEQGKEGAGCGDGPGALTRHLREGGRGMAAGIAHALQLNVLCEKIAPLIVPMCVFLFSTTAAWKMKVCITSYEYGFYSVLTEASAAVAAAAICPPQNAGREKVCCALLRYCAVVRVGRLWSPRRSASSILSHTPHTAATTAHRTSKCTRKLLHMAGHRSPIGAFSRKI